MIPASLLLLAPALFAAVQASPVAEVIPQVFSFADWIEGIITNPDGDNLSPDGAVEAWKASLNATEGHESGSLEKRATCNFYRDCSAGANDAVWCLNRLADLGRQGVVCRACPSAQMCVRGSAEIIGAAGGGTTCSSSNCNDIARAGGFIMDSCWRADNTVMGQELAYGNGNLAVTILRPYNCHLFK